MTNRKDETASFLLRFRQMIYENESGESQIQWRGVIQHVQGGEEKKFSEFSDVIEFVQDKLSELTIQALENKSPEEQKSIISKSFDLWKRMATSAPKKIIDTIKDPKTQVAQLQQQIQEQIQDMGDSIGQKFDLDVLKRFTNQENDQLLSTLDDIATRLSMIEERMGKLEK